MGKDTEISWTDHSFSPWEGCEKVSPGCRACYAWVRNRRWHKGENWGPGTPRLERSENYWKEPVRWAKAAENDGVRRRVFCAPVADYLEDHPTAERLRPRLFDLVRDTAYALDWLLLTKRAERLDLVPRDVRERAWGLVTAEDQEWADKRVPLLLASKGWRVRGVSYEPALGPVDFKPWLPYAIAGCCPKCGHPFGTAAHFEDEPCKYPASRLSWVIGGSESAGSRPGRPDDLAWYRSARADCAAAGVAYFQKQMHLDGALVKDIARFPADLRVRQFPAAGGDGRSAT